MEGRRKEGREGGSERGREREREEVEKSKREGRKEHSRHASGRIFISTLHSYENDHSPSACPVGVSVGCPW